MGEHLFVLEFNKLYKKKIFGLMPYSSVRMSVRYYFTYPDTPFGNQHVYKSNSLKSIVNLKDIKLNKKISLPEWNSRNKGLFRNNSVGLSSKLSSNKAKVGTYESMNCKSNRIYFNKTILSTSSPKKIYKIGHTHSTSQTNIEKMRKEKEKEKNKKLRDLQVGIARVLLPAQKPIKKKPTSFVQMIAEMRAKSKTKTKKNQNEMQKSIFYEDPSTFVDFNQPVEEVLNNYNYLGEMNMILNSVIAMSRKDNFTKEDVFHTISSFFMIDNLYKKQHNILMERNKFFKAKLSSFIRNIESIENILNEYNLINNLLYMTSKSTSIKEQRNDCLLKVERALIKELKLVKFFRLEYDHEQHINNEKRLLQDIIGKIAKSDNFQSLPSDKKTKIVRLTQLNYVG